MLESTCAYRLLVSLQPRAATSRSSAGLGTRSSL